LLCKCDSTNAKTAVIIDAELRLFGNGSVAMQATAAVNAKNKNGGYRRETASVSLAVAMQV
jgi:hypothetical protein